MSAALDAANQVRRLRATIRSEIHERSRREAWAIIGDYIIDTPTGLATMTARELLAMNMWAPVNRVAYILDESEIGLTAPLGTLTSVERGLLVAAIDAEIARKSPLDMED